MRVFLVMKSFPVVFLIFFIPTTFASAQYSKMLHKSHEEQYEHIDLFYENVIVGRMQPQVFADTLKEMRALARKEGDENLLLEADYAALYYDVYFGSGKIEPMIEFQLENEELGNIYFACRSAAVVARFYWGIQEYQKTLDWYLHLEELLNEVTVEEFPGKLEYVFDLGRVYYSFGDYGKAALYFNRVIEFPLTQPLQYSWRHSLNNLGLSYQKLGMLDSSDYAFTRLLAHGKETSEQWVGIASGNLATNHYLRGEFDLAIPLFLIDLQIAERFNDFGLAAGSGTALADIFVQKGELQLAKSYINKSYQYISVANAQDRLRKLYPVMSKWESVMGNSRRANLYLDSAMEANRIFNEKFSAVQLMRANQSVIASQNDKILNELNKKVRKNRAIRNGVIVGLIVVMIFAFFLYWVKNERNKSQRKLKNLELEQAHKELENAKVLLKEYTNKISTNTSIIQSITDREFTAENNELLNKLRASTILTESDWLVFKKQFRKAFPELIEKLLARHPELSPAELRYLLLLKLKLSKNEVANALGISKDSLRVSWYRLRKKLDLQKDIQQTEVFEKHFVDL